MTIPPPEIIAREQAYWHGFGRSVTEQERPLSGVDKLLMSDDTITYGCQHCEYTNDNMKSVQTHLTKHSTKGIGTTRYAPEIIAKVVELREIERAQSVRGWPERVAHRMNKLKIKTLSGNPWLAQDVYSLARHYPDSPLPADVLHGVATVATVTALVTNPETPKVIEAIGKAARSGLYSSLDADLRARMAETTSPVMTANIIHDLVDLLTAQANAAKPCGHDDYEELKSKAAMLDQMRSFMGEGK